MFIELAINQFINTDGISSITLEDSKRNTDEVSLHINYFDQSKRPLIIPLNRKVGEKVMSDLKSKLNIYSIYEETVKHESISKT